MSSVLLSSFTHEKFLLFILKNSLGRQPAYVMHKCGVS